MEFEREYSKLNSGQKRAVDNIEGPLLVIAGPGTGKTQLLSLRTANILKKTDVAPSNILCLTFTEAAAENMRIRLNKLVGLSSNQVSIFTFHGFGEYIIQNYPEFFYDAPLLNPLNELGEYDLIEKLMNKLHHDNPLAKRINGTYLHISAVIRTISWFKQAGLSADEIRLQSTSSQSFFKEVNEYISDAFQESPSYKNIEKYNKLLSQLLDSLSRHPNETAKVSTLELAAAIDELDPSSRYAKSITSWRSKWLTEIKKGKWRYSDQQKNIFLLHLADLYEKYQEKLTSSGHYTFDDMILRTTNAIDKIEELKLILQEKYQYILVDEYQDTNAAQDKILKQLAENRVNEGRPNLMVVGDDDQAIYRFQGANISVMQEFINTWEPEKIVLSESYRSSQALLDLARGVIINAENRLEEIDKSLTKKLISKVSYKNSSIIELYSTTESENYLNIANEISRLIKKGISPSTIALLAPKHKYLEQLVPYLVNLKIPINYERREQILSQPRIIEIIDLIELISAASKYKTNKIESLLPKILAAEYWQLSPNDLWNIALDAQKDRQGWLSVLEKNKNEDLVNFSNAIKLLSKESSNQSFELLLGYLTGNKSVKLADNKLWQMPWRNYYYSENTLNNDPSGYINFMAQFDTLKRAFNDWSPNNNTLRSLSDFEEFINLYKRTNIKLSDNSPFTTSKDAVTLMTVFKAKGLEWDSVFVLNVEDDVWGAKAKGRNQSFSLPSTLKWIQPVIDSSNDLIRLFYVGITRAKVNLYLTSYDYKESGQSAERLIWLNDLLTLPKMIPQANNLLITTQLESEWQDKYHETTNDLEVLLKPFLENYKLSSTHLNDFLSVDMGGPKYFLYRHLLKVPEELNPNAMFGDSIHKTLEFIHKQLNQTKSFPSINAIKEFYLDKLKNQALTKDEFKYFKKRGEDNLLNWLESNKNAFNNTDISEHDFSPEKIVIDKARLTGKIDVIRSINNNELLLIDYKTSSPIESWTRLSGNAAIKANNYKNQLIFYKLLVDNSSRFIKSKVKQGMITFTSPNDENNFINLEYDYSESDVEKVKKLIAIVWDKIINLDLPSVEHYPSSIKGIKAFEDDLLNGNI